MNREMRGRARFLTAAIAALALGAAEARADQLFTLSGVVFNDGTAITGTFTTNDALNALLDFDLTTVDGAVTGLHYVPGTVDDSSTSLPAIIVLSTASPFRSFQLTLDGLTTAGAPVLIGQFDSFEQTAAGRREIVAGSVVGAAIPEPSSALLAGPAALAALAIATRRRRAG